VSDRGPLAEAAAPPPPAAGAARRAGLRSLVRSLSHRNFRLFFFGQGVSLIGTWMQQIAMTWLVYRLTDQEFLLGLTAFAGQVPTFFLAPLAGVLSDRLDRWRIQLVTQTLSMLQAFLLAALALTGVMAVWQIIVLAVVLGFVNAFDMISRQALLTEMLENREDLGNAIALNSLTFNGARLIGPSLAGFLIGLLGEGVCFLVNGVSYLAVLAALLAMRLPPRERPADHPPLAHGLREGVVYAFGSAPIRALLLLVAVVALSGVSYAVLMPVFAKHPDLLHGDSRTFGLLMSAAGCGALAGGAYLAARKSVLGLLRRIGLAPAVVGCGLVAMSYPPFTQTLALALPLLFLIGLAMMVQMASINTLLQTIVDDDKRGRVLSFYTMAFMGMAPLGSLLAGALSEVVGAPVTVRLGGFCCLAASALFLLRLPGLRASIRPIYIRLGILPAPRPAGPQVVPVGGGK
jgi:MFS family permease